MEIFEKLFLIFFVLDFYQLNARCIFEEATTVASTEVSAFFSEVTSPLSVRECSSPGFRWMSTNVFLS